MWESWNGEIFHYNNGNIFEGDLVPIWEEKSLNKTLSNSRGHCKKATNWWMICDNVL